MGGADLVFLFYFCQVFHTGSCFLEDSMSSWSQGRPSHSCTIHTTASSPRQLFYVNSYISYILEASLGPGPLGLGAVLEVGVSALKRERERQEVLSCRSFGCLNCFRVTTAVYCGVIVFIAAVMPGHERGPPLPLSLERSKDPR